MSTDYTPAIISLVGIIVLFTGMVGYVLSSPSDLAPNRR
jgi:hypothetical protein